MAPCFVAPCSGLVTPLWQLRSVKLLGESLCKLLGKLCGGKLLGELLGKLLCKLLGELLGKLLRAPALVAPL